MMNERNKAGAVPTTKKIKFIKKNTIKKATIATENKTKPPIPKLNLDKIVLKNDEKVKIIKKKL